MGYSSKGVLIEVKLPTNPDYWVKVETDFTYGEVKTVDPDSKGFVVVDKTLSLALKEWNLDDDTGNILEINQENIDLLKQDDITAIMNAINKEVADDSTKKGL